MEAVEERPAGAQPFVGKGAKFTLAEWDVVARLMDETGLNFTQVMKRGLKILAARHDLDWPEESVTSSKSA